MDAHRQLVFPNMTIHIEFCKIWNYEPRALRARDLLVEKGETVEIAPGRTGSFEITRGGAVLYSKLKTHRFPEDNEVRALARGDW